MSDVLGHRQIRRVLAFAGLLSMFIATLPWLGLGGYYFGVPGWELDLPRLHLIELPGLYRLIAEPVALVGLIPPLGSVIFFQGEGVVTVRPFVVFLFYFLFGLTSLWFAFRHCFFGAEQKPKGKTDGL